MGVSPNGKARDFDSRIIGSIPVTPAKDVVAEQVERRYNRNTPVLAGSCKVQILTYILYMLPSSNWNRRLAFQAGNASSSLAGSTILGAVDELVESPPSQGGV